MTEAGATFYEGGDDEVRRPRFVHTGSLILTPKGVWWTVNDEEPARWRGDIETLVAIMCGTAFELPEKFFVRLRRDCAKCGDFVKFDRSCDCFDNGCQ